MMTHWKLERMAPFCELVLRQSQSVTVFPGFKPGSLVQKAITLPSRPNFLPVCFLSGHCGFVVGPENRIVRFRIRVESTFFRRPVFRRRRWHRHRRRRRWGRRWRRAPHLSTLCRRCLPVRSVYLGIVAVAARNWKSKILSDYGSNFWAWQQRFFFATSRIISNIFFLLGLMTLIRFFVQTEKHLTLTLAPPPPF